MTENKALCGALWRSLDRAEDAVRNAMTEEEYTHWTREVRRIRQTIDRLTPKEPTK